MRDHNIGFFGERKKKYTEQVPNIQNIIRLQKK